MPTMLLSPDVGMCCRWIPDLCRRFRFIRELMRGRAINDGASHCAIRFIIFMLLFYPNEVFAGEVQIALFEQRISEQSGFLFDTGSMKLRKVQTAVGVELPTIARYESRAGKLYSNGTALAEADEVLFQCEVDEVDLVVVRDEYNSFSNPLRILSALSGHPVQVSKIVILTIANGQVEAEKELTRKPSSYGWVVSVLR